MDGRAYGAGKAIQGIDPLRVIKKPRVILRLVSLLFSIIVFGCISSQAWYTDKEGYTWCQYNHDSNACSFGVAVGVIAFLGLILFLVSDVIFENLSSIKTRKHIVIADMGISGLWTFMWFICFCYLTNAWSRSVVENLPRDGSGRNGVQGAITFCFFSIFTWAGMTFFAVKRFREGVSATFMPGYDQDAWGTSPQQGAAPASSAYPGVGDSQTPYQEQPFGSRPAGGMGGVVTPSANAIEKVQFPTDLQQLSPAQVVRAGDHSTLSMSGGASANAVSPNAPYYA
ncbi:PREDICTED: synaptogyrin-1-like [Priapulus caudatus]|uniref:Synaptogyrin-1-like n=1 Tax=Priapulus caudatus TaxID=37621 RepID=A0ABM1DXA5_PRICU|nr:PREDICTED: synaptogyrin-1-like [Priapulus caudatus]